MNFLKNSSRNNRIMAKFLAGEMSAGERAIFEKKVAGPSDNGLLLNEITNYWGRMEYTDSHTEFNTEKAWSNLHARIQEEAHVAESRTLRLSAIKWYARVAVLALLIALGGAIAFTDVLFTKSIVVAHSAGDPTTLVYPLSDGSVVYLSNGTTLTLSKKFGKRVRHVSLQGEAFFDVMPNPQKPFTVETGNAIIRVLGTSFSLKSHHRNDFELAVESGTVSVIDKDKKAELLIAKAGDMVKLVDNNFRRTMYAADPSERWYNKRLQFKDETVFHIIRVINKCYGANIIVESPTIGDKRITVTFDNSNINSMVTIISATLNLEPKYLNDTILLTTPDHGQ